MALMLVVFELSGSRLTNIWKDGGYEEPHLNEKWKVKNILYVKFKKRWRVSFGKLVIQTAMNRMGWSDAHRATEKIDESK